MVTFISAFGLSESLSELEPVDSSDPKASSNCVVKGSKRLGRQQQQCHPEAWALSKHSTPRFLLMQPVQKSVLHDLQLTKSALWPHHPQ